MAKAKKEDEGQAKVYEVLTPVDFNNERLEPGSQVELSAADAKPLLAVKAIKDPAGE